MVRKIAAIVIPGMVMLLMASCSSEDSTNPPKTLDQQQAIDAVKKAILPMVLQPGDRYACIRMDGSVAAGIKIEEDAPPMGGGLQSAPPVSTVLGEESFFFYLDLSPNTVFAHDVKYIIIGRSGRYQVLNAQWWPRIGGRTYGRFMKAVPDSQYVIAGNADLTLPGGSIMRFSPYGRGTPSTEGFIVVQGLMPGEALYDQAESTYVEMLNYFIAYALPSAEVAGLVEANADNVFAEIDGMALAKKKTVTIAVIAHGNTDYVRLGGVGVTADDFAGEIGSHPDVTFNLILCSCHGGSFLDNLKPLANVLVAHTSSRGNESAYPDWDTAGGVTDYNPDDAGAEWMSSVVAAANVIAGDPVKWSMIVAAASNRGAPATSVLLHEACLGAIGSSSAFGLIENLDLMARVVGGETPQGYAIWEPGVQWGSAQWERARRGSERERE